MIKLKQSEWGEVNSKLVFYNQDSIIISYWWA
jgi:hypothetical protein